MNGKKIKLQPPMAQPEENGDWIALNSENWKQKYQDLKSLLEICQAKGGIGKKILLANIGQQDKIKDQLKMAVAQRLALELVKSGAIRFVEEQNELSLNFIIGGDVVVIRDREKLKQLEDSDGKDEPG